MLLALVATTASAQDFEVDGICYNILSEDDRTVMVTESPYGYSGEVVIPACFDFSRDAVGHDDRCLCILRMLFFDIYLYAVCHDDRWLCILQL